MTSTEARLIRIASSTMRERWDADRRASGTALSARSAGARARRHVGRAAERVSLARVSEVAVRLNPRRHVTDAGPGLARLRAGGVAVTFPGRPLQATWMLAAGSPTSAPSIPEGEGRARGPRGDQ